VLELLGSLAKRGKIAGIDLVETAPAYAPAGVTDILAAQLLLNVIGRMFAPIC
jgi:agmatinase